MGPETEPSEVQESPENGALEAREDRIEGQSDKLPHTW